MALEMAATSFCQVRALKISFVIFSLTIALEPFHLLATPILLVANITLSEVLIATKIVMMLFATEIVMMLFATEITEMVSVTINFFALTLHH